MTYLLEHEDYNHINFSWITSRIACGGHMAGPSDGVQLRSLGVTHVVDVHMEGLGKWDEEAWCAAAGVEYLYVRPPQMDDGSNKPAQWFSMGLAFCLLALAQRPDTKVFIHCGGGINRAPTMVYALLRALGMPPTQAEFLIKAKRLQARIGYMHNAEEFMMGCLG